MSIDKVSEQRITKARSIVNSENPSKWPRLELGVNPKYVTSNVNLSPTI